MSEEKTPRTGAEWAEAILGKIGFSTTDAGATLTELQQALTDPHPLRLIHAFLLASSAAGVAQMEADVAEAGRHAFLAGRIAAAQHEHGGLERLRDGWKPLSETAAEKQARASEEYVVYLERLASLRLDATLLAAMADAIKMRALAITSLEVVEARNADPNAPPDALVDWRMGVNIIRRQAPTSSDN